MAKRTDWLPDEPKYGFWERRFGEYSSQGITVYRHWVSEDELVFTPAMSDAYRVHLIDKDLFKVTSDERVFDVGYIFDLPGLLNIIQVMNQYESAKAAITGHLYETRKRYDGSLSDG